MNSPANYPAWLGLGLLNGLDWSRSAASTIPRLLQEYTLHDSSWIGLWSEPGFESLALIGWDTHWSRGRLPYPIAGTPAGYPFLLIQFERLWRGRFRFGDEYALPTIAHATSRLVPQAEKLNLNLIGSAAPGEIGQEHARSHKYLEQEILFHTIVTPVVGGDVELWHGGTTRFLCLDAAGNALAIPDL